MPAFSSEEMNINGEYLTEGMKLCDEKAKVMRSARQAEKAAGERETNYFYA